MSIHRDLEIEDPSLGVPGSSWWTLGDGHRHLAVWSKGMKNGLRRKFILAVIFLGVLSVAIALVATAWRGTAALRETLGDNFQGLAHETSQKVDIAIIREITVLQHMSNAEVVKAAVMENNTRYEGTLEAEIFRKIQRAETAWEKSDAAARAKQMSSKASAFLEESVKLEKEEGVQFVTFVTDKEGVLVASTTAVRPYQYAREDWWVKTMQLKGEAVFLSNVYQNKKTDRYVFDLAVPIFNRGSSEAIGAIKIVFDLKGFLSPLIVKTRFGQTGHAMLIDSEGTVLACPILPTGMHIPEGVLITAVTAMDPGWIVAEDDAHGGKNSIVGFSPVGEVLNISAPFDGNRWHSFIRQAPEETYAPIDSLLRTIFYSGGLSIGFLVIIGFVVAGRLVEPIQVLQKGAEEIGKGDLDHRLDIRTGDEIEQLAEEFNKMAEKLKISHVHLEEEVAERTMALRETVAKLQEADRLKSEFLSNISHELRTPLTSIIGFSEILIDQVSGDLNEIQMGYVKNMLHSGQNQLELISNLLDLSKIRSGRMQTSLEPFRIQEVLDSTIMTIIPLIEKEGLHLVREIQEGLPEILADKGKVRQILLNLLSNAIKFTGEGGMIKIGGHTTTHERKLFLEISVTDTGVGIRQNDQEIIFDEFRQVDASYTRDYPGTGLGLPITKHFVEMHGGSIWVKSESGRGSTFTFTLPVEVPAEGWTETKRAGGRETVEAQAVSKVKREKSPVGSVGETDRPVILVVEDDPMVSQLITLHLTQAGYEIAHAYNGDEAILKARALNPFAITLDIMLPGKDGWQVLQELQSDLETRDIPVVILSMVENTELGLSLGTVDYLMKPIDKQALLNTLTKLDLKKKVMIKPVTILVLEHNPHMLAEIKNILRETAFGVISASEIEEGIDLALEGRPDLILLGLTGFPEENGIGLPQRLVKHRIIKNIPIVAYLQEELTRELKERLEGEIRKIIHYDKKSIREALLFEIKKYEKLYPDKAKMIDGLTGLYNERYFRSRLDGEVEAAFRYKRIFSLMATNVDGFKEYNERNGVERGNEALRNIADAFRINLRSADSISRFGGSTFMILMTETIKESGTLAAGKLRRIVESLSFPHQEGKAKERLTISIGISTFLTDAQTGEEIVSKAFSALERAQNEGGNRIVDAGKMLTGRNQSDG